jgi:hypothetical protein
MYFHTWELDPRQPKVNGVPWLERIRQYRNLDKMGGYLRHYLDRYHFGSIADYLGVAHGASARARRSARATASAPRLELSPIRPANTGVEGTRRTAVSIVVPCYNEELIFPYLSNTLQSVEQALGGTYELRFLLVDDGSSDGTWPALQNIFGARVNCTPIRHAANQGVAAAIMTGIRSATTEIVCSIDCDCTYDPLQLGDMIPLLQDGVDMVTASP